jgi:hypothetical protein
MASGDLSERLAENSTLREDIYVREEAGERATEIGEGITDLIARCEDVADANPGTYILWDTLRVCRSPGPEPYVCYIVNLTVGKEEWP